MDSLPTPLSPSARIEVKGIGKRFPGVQALEAVDLRVNPGEVVAVIGENGAGKSTLMKIMAGIESPDTGTMRLDGQPVHFRSPREAIRSGVALIHQELNLAENLSVAENVFLGREPSRCGLLRRREMQRQAREHLQAVGLDVDPAMALDRLPLAGQQLVEIAKAISADARLVIMDEPTSSLSIRETRRLFEVIERLKKSDVAMVYISHRLGEVERLADRVEVLRDGRNGGVLVGESITHDTMVSRMVGRDLDQFFPHAPHVASEAPTRLRVEGLVVETSPRYANDFSVRGGEVVAIAGLVGSGRSELVETLFGVRPALGGRVLVDGRDVALGSPRTMMRSGLALVPEDRKQSGLFLENSVRENLMVTALSDSHVAPFTSRGWEREVSGELIARLRVKTGDQETILANLSGGNQQKVAVGKWLTRNPGVFILDEPTRGVDVGAKHEIYELMERLAAQGVAILFVSSEMEEVIGMADRVLVMHDGAIRGERGRDAVSEEAIMQLAVGAPISEVIS